MNKFLKPFALGTAVLWSGLAIALSWELRFDDSSGPLRSGRIELSEPVTVRKASEKIFASNHISYSLDGDFFSFIDGKSWPWCFYVKSKTAHIPGLSPWLEERLYSLNEKVRLPSDMVSNGDKLIWCHCQVYPLSMDD